MKTKKKHPSTEIPKEEVLPPPPSLLTTVITNCGRPDKLWEAFESTQKAGVPSVVVISVQITPEVREVHARIRKANPKTKIMALDKDPGCNMSWLIGVLAVKTEWAHILHDDDIVKPDFWKALEPVLKRNDVEFVLFDAAQHHSDGKIRPHCKLWDKADGIYPNKSFAPHLEFNPYSISPVSGAFRTQHLKSVLSEFQKECASKKEFIFRPNMHVGNDLLIWLRATELPGMFRYISKPLVSYGNHLGSTTVSDQKLGEPRLPGFYAVTKQYWRSHRKWHSIKATAAVVPGKPSIATFLYLPDVDKEEKFLAHLNKCERAFDLHILTDKTPENGATPVTVIPKLGPFFKLAGCAPSDQYAFMAFLHTIKQAVAMKLEYFLLIENDCRFGANGWDGAMWEEFKSKPGALFGGTPVCWHPWAHGHEMSRAIIEFAFHYQEKSGVAMAFEGEHNGKWGTSIYPNGALAIYNTKELVEYFRVPLDDMDKPLKRQAEMCTERHAFDMHIGREMVRRYGVIGALKSISVFSSIYSGCGPHHLNPNDRIALLSSGKKLAVHQIKDHTFL